MATPARGRPRISLPDGARNVAWHDAVATTEGKSDKELDETYANYGSDGSQRSDGGRKDVFGRISRNAYDPAHAVGPDAMSVLEAVERYTKEDKVVIASQDVYKSQFWKLLSTPPLSEPELRELIDDLLVRHYLYRVPGENPELDIMAGNTFLKEKRPFRYAEGNDLYYSIAEIAAWDSFDGLALLSALSRERLLRGTFEHMEWIKDQFQHSLMRVVDRYNLRKDIQLLIDWLAHYRIFSNRWDEVPTDETRGHALAHINRIRSAKNKKPAEKVDFWVEALAIRYHNTERCHLYPIVAKMQDLRWLEKNRVLLGEQMVAADSGEIVEGMHCPIFEIGLSDVEEARRIAESEDD